MSLQKFKQRALANAEVKADYYLLESEFEYDSSFEIENVELINNRMLLLLDENEVVVNASNSTGEFQLQVSNDTLSTMQLKTIYLVAKQSFSNEETYFASPLAAYVFPLASGNFNSSPAVISPLSSLVVAEILRFFFNTMATRDMAIRLDC